MNTRGRGSMRSAVAVALAALLVAAVAPLAAATPAEIQAALNAAYTKYKDIQEGANADYIPALAKVNSKLFGIAVVTLDGKVHSVGDADSLFSIQSISKVFTMARVMQDSGEKVIETDYDPSRMQDHLFVIPSFAWLRKEIEDLVRRFKIPVI